MAEHNFHIISANELYKKDLPKIEYLVDNLLMKGSLTYIVGPPASFKTNLMMYMAINGSLGRNVFTYKTNKPFRTLFIDEENGQINTKDKLIKVLNGEKIDVKELLDNKILFSCISQFKLNQFDVNSLEKKIKDFDVDVIVIDNVARCMEGSERDEKDVSNILNLLKPLIERYNVSFVIIHHTRKGSEYNLESMSGSRDFGAQCDNAFILCEISKLRTTDSKTFLLKQVKCKHGMEMPAINFIVQGNDEKLVISYKGKAHDIIGEGKRKELYTKILLWWQDNPSNKKKTKDITNYWKDKGYSIGTTTNTLNDMCESGVLRKGVRENYGWMEWVGENE